MIKKKTHLNECKELYKIHKSSEKVAVILANKYGVKNNGTLARKLRSWVGNDKNKLAVKIEDSEQFKTAQSKKPEVSKYYIVTAAQNATGINKKFLKNIEAYASHLDAAIEVIPIRYRNPTSVFTDKKDDWWDEAVVKYLIASRHSLNKNLSILADIKTQPTASKPLNGMNALTGIESSIIAHPRQHLKFVPTLDSYPKKVMLSTGVVTEKNYTDSSVGKKGEFHHTFGFIIIEIKNNKTFFVRQVSAKDDGSFIDLDTEVKNGEVYTDEKVVEAVVFGDMHLRKVNEEALNCAIGITERFKPKHLIIHDLFDGDSINHHEAKEPFILMQKELEGRDIVEREVEECLTFIESIKKYNPVIIRSNHDIFLDRWLKDVDWRKNTNKYTYLKYAMLTADGKAPNGIFPYEVEQRFNGSIKCLTEDDSYVVANVELGQHGHRGAHGSKGSLEQFKTFNIKMVTAHTHSPAKEDGVTVVGTLTDLRHGYNKGFSAWMHSVVIVNKHEKIQNLLIVDGEFSTI